MQVAAPQQHRVVRGHPVQCFAGGHARRGPVRLVPSLSHDPLAWPPLVGCPPNARQQVLKAGEVIQLHILTLERPFIEVDMRIDKPRNHQATVEVDLLGVCAGQVQHIIVVADGPDAPLTDGHGLCKRLLGNLGGNAAVEEDDFGKGIGCNHNKNPLGKGSLASRTNW